jgi:hypothetical protein
VDVDCKGLVVLTNWGHKDPAITLEGNGSEGDMLYMEAPGEFSR